MEIAELKEALEQLVFKEPNFFNRIIRISGDNVTTKDDLKLLFELINKRFEDVNKRFEDMQRYMDKRFEDIQRYMDKRFEDMQKYMDKRFEDVNRRFEDIQKYMDKRFNFITRLIFGFNVPLLLTMIGLLLTLLFKK